LHLEEIIKFLSDVNPIIIYLVIFGISYIENIFPPSPSDVIVLFGGSLIALGKGNFIAILLAASCGSLLGFLSMYFIGKWFGKRFLDSGKLRFISVMGVQKVENWFRKYGYGIIIANRFLAGTRAVVSFFAGIANLNIKITTLLSFVSALLWNFILLYAGFQMGKNWQIIISKLETYWLLVSACLLMLVLIFLIRYILSKKYRNA
jgi:membrane protein DedA with SNARE-associated domain